MGGALQPTAPFIKSAAGERALHEAPLRRDGGKNTVGAIHESPPDAVMTTARGGWMANGIVSTVGRDDYPKGTGSTSRSCLAGCRWRSARRTR